MLLTPYHGTLLSIHYDNNQDEYMKITDRPNNSISAITFILNWALLIGIPCIFLTILFNNAYIYNYPLYKEDHYLFAVFISLIAVIALINELILKKNKYKITSIDIAVIFFILSCIISRIGYLHNNYLNEIIVNFFVVCSIYLIVRLVFSNKLLNILLYTISLTVIIEAIYICFTLCSVYHFHNYYLFLKGTLDNSGLCAGYIVFGSAIILYLLKNVSVWFTYFFYFVVFIILCLLQSRAALLAFVPIACFNDILRQYMKSALQSKLMWIILVVVSVFLSIWLFIIKEDSARGRVLIWDLTLEHSFQSPVYGIGYGEFPVSYKSWQSDYFKSSNYNPDYIDLAGLPNNCFNEPLQIFIETGIIGFLSFLAIVISIYRSSSLLNPTLMGFLKLALFSLLIFSLFSYPFHCLPILTLSIIIVAIISNLSISEFSIPIEGTYARWSFFIIFLLSLCAGVYLFKKSDAINTWKIARKTEKVNPLNSLKIYDSVYSLLQDNGAFLFDYGMALFDNKQYQQSISVLTKCNKLLSKIETTILLGRDYQAIGKFKEAEKMYFNSMYCMPSRLIAKYYLLKLYIQERDTINARNLSKDIIQSPVKVYTIEAAVYQQFADSTFIKLK